jgi:hypothetical protein
VERLYKKAVDTGKQKQQREECYVMTVCGQTVDGYSGHRDTESTDEHCDVLRDIGQTLEGMSGHNDTDKTEGGG